jgi:ribosomal-protein-serine acetyltransferase
MFTLKVDDEIELRLVSKQRINELHEVIVKNLDYLAEWMPWAHENYTIEDALSFYERGVQRYLDKQGIDVSIYYQGKIVGGTGFAALEWIYQKAEIGYWIAADMQGQGIVTRSCKSLISHAFSELKLHRVEIHCAFGNTKSRAIPEKLGFKSEGVLREAHLVNNNFSDLVIYGLLADEWASTKKS